MKNYVTELKWGLIFVFAAFLWMYIEKWMGWHGPKIEQHQYMTNIFAVVAILVYILAIRDKKKNDLNGKMSWKQGFISGCIITAVVAVLSPLSQWITHTYITPDYFPNVINYAVSEGLNTQAEAEAYFNLQSYILQSFIGALVMGLITSAIVAFFMRTKGSSLQSADAA